MYREVKWIRTGSPKLCSMLRKEALEWYRPIKYIPCFIQQPLMFLKQRLRKLPVIVQLNESITTQRLQNVALETGTRLQKELSIINAFTAKVSVKELEALTNNPGIKKIWYDRSVHALLDIASPVVKAPEIWETGFDGKGVTVAVLDTGIYEHPDLTTPSNRILAFVDLVKNSAAPYDDHGHGTHVAGDIGSGGASSSGFYRGPAPQVNLVGVKVLDKQGSGSLSTVIQGLNWCINKKEELGIKVINLSLGSKATASYRDDPLCQAVEKAWLEGIVVCAAAGNEGPSEKTINSPGIDPVIITVGAVDDKNTVDMHDDKIAEFSSRGPTIDGLVKPDVVAPGVNIISLNVPGSINDKRNKGNNQRWYTSMSGTSMATPVCAGVVALMLQANPGLTPDEVKYYLKKTAIDTGNDQLIQGTGLVDAHRAVEVVSLEKVHRLRGIEGSLE